MPLGLHITLQTTVAHVLLYNVHLIKLVFLVLISERSKILHDFYLVVTFIHPMTLFPPEFVRFSSNAHYPYVSIL